MSMPIEKIKLKDPKCYREIKLRREFIPQCTLPDAAGQIAQSQVNEKYSEN